MQYDIVIIGGGLGGLQCAYILSRKGYNVCVLEKESHAGGCLQVFSRRGMRFDTGFHYVGGLDSGQAMYRLMDYYGLLGLPWHRLDPACYDEVIINGKRYPFPNGHEAFVETMSEYFPHQRTNLDNYSQLLKKVGNNVFDVFGEGYARMHDFHNSLFSEPAYGYLRNTFDDEALINVLAGTSLKLEPHHEKLPLYIFAQTNESYLESAWRMKGGGEQVALALVSAIRYNGGSVICGKEVVELVEKKGRIAAARTSDGDTVEGRIFISDIHPSSTVDLVGKSEVLRSSYRKRVGRLDNTFGMFTVNIKLKPRSLPYLNRNLHIHEGGSVWSHCCHILVGAHKYVFASYAVPDQGAWATGIDLLSPMYWEEVSQWANTEIGRRGEGYKDFKNRRADEIIGLADRHIPGLKSAIDTIYTSTPLTWRDYTGTPEGSAYGIRKDYSQLTYTVIPPRTPIGNLFLTGQNLSVHGIMGVSMTSLLTSAQVAGREILDDFLKNY